jgi:hypothetical protein
MEKSSYDYLLQQVNPVDLRNYLIRNRWSEESFPRQDVLKFKSPHPIRADGKYIDIFVPINKDLIDYKRMVNYALKSVSSFEKRSLFEIINQVLNFADCLRTRIIEAKKGKIPLEQGIILYGGLLNLITFSASSEYESKPVKKFNRKLDKAISYAETTLMGQSEVGSYVANIYLPLRGQNLAFPWDPTGTFSRRVVLRILRGLEDLNNSMIEGSSQPIISNYTTGLNSNMCDALINIIDAGMGNDVVFDAVMEPIIPIPDHIHRSFILRPIAKRYLENAIEELKEDVPEEEERPFYGFVTLLRRPEEIEKGMIRLRSIDAENNKTRNIRIELNPSDYQKAVDAHGLRRNIRIKGVLEKAGRTWQLRDPNNLEILEEDSELPWRSLYRFS